MPTLSITREGNDRRFSWTSRTNQLYQLQWSPVLPAADWFGLGSPVLGTGTTIFLTDTNAPQATKFYRLIELQ
jgi:hypothetical protein